MYIYIVSENELQVHTSNIFYTLQQAVDYFLNEDVPNHYSKDTFIKVSGNCFVNSAKNSKCRIKASFFKVDLQTLTQSEWEKIKSK